MAIYVADAVMSSGKTEAAIHFINSSSAEKRSLFITPFLSECDRIANTALGTPPARRFVPTVPD